MLSRMFRERQSGMHFPDTRFYHREHCSAKKKYIYIFRYSDLFNILAKTFSSLAEAAYREFERSKIKDIDVGEIEEVRFAGNRKR